MADPLAAEDGLELVDVELTVQGGRRTIRVLLDRPGGIQVGDCARFSRRLSDCLDMNQTVPGRYFLEVSSPGVQRPIKTLETVERFAGQRASLTTVAAIDGRRNYEGELLGPRDGRAGIRTDEGTEHWFVWAEVKAAHLVVDPWAGRRAGAPRQGGGSR
ncbi:MAG TPA: ribosome maturation factor RimP [Candidatus Eisenbacteria bacterium]|nr:ribosome maturation factor RimP [Candidatus Eisenbacteria bacterium]